MVYIGAIVIVILAVMIAYLISRLFGKILDFFSNLIYPPKGLGQTITSTVTSSGNTLNMQSSDMYSDNFGSYSDWGSIEQRSDSSYEVLWDIAGEYGDSIPTKITLPGIYPNSVLPYTREKIKHALATLILIENNPAAVELLCFNYLTLAKFVPDEYYSLLANIFGEIDSADKEKNLSDLAELATKTMIKSKEDVANNVAMIYQHLDNREYDSLFELVALRQIIGSNPEPYLSRLKELSKKQ